MEKMERYKKIEKGTPLQLNYNDKSDTVLFVDRENSTNYFFNGKLVFAFTDKFIKDNVTIQYDNLNAMEIAKLLELANQSGNIL